MDKKMFNKNQTFRHDRVKSSLIKSDKSINPYNNKILFSNNTNLSTMNTLSYNKSKFNTINRNKDIYKIKSIKSPFSQEKEKLNLKRIKIKQTPIITKKNSSIISPYDISKKKYLRGKLCNLMQKNIILCESKFHPRKYTESISNVHVKGFKNRFKNLDDRNKVGIFTNKYPSILNNGDKFYSRYFDYFMSPDEILAKNFNSKEIYQIKTDPGFYNIGGSFTGVNFFKRKKLRDTLNEEEKIGIKNIMEADMIKSLRKSRRKIKSYLNYYTSIMSRRGFIHK